ncbi:MAG: 3-oxoacyl-[acyl-carrier-protein] synthase [Actinomycetota bacterium]|nr:3-oxoacyl-[acyl-carrier-protein] synthase [Actinomycetota bacterium]
MAITGIGTVLPGTRNVKEFWGNISRGRSQVSRLTRFDSKALGLPVGAASQINDFDYREYLPALDSKHAAKYTREILIAMSAVEQARHDAGIVFEDVDPKRTSIVMSSSRGPLEWWQSTMTGSQDRPFSDSGAMFRGLSGCPASMAAIYTGAQGLVTTVSNACVGGHHAIGIGLNELRSGNSDVVLVGGHEFPILPEVARCYLALGDGVLSPEQEVPTRAVRPYSKDRAGFALGEGSVVLCLEREATARARGARIYARLLAHGAMNEANHPTTMDMTGDLTAGLIKRTLEKAGAGRDDLGYVCGHGTATRYNDLAESRALRSLYRGRAPEALPPHTSNKPIYGHTFGMAGIINVAATSQMLHRQQIAPTINLTEVDPECDHDHVAEGLRDVDIDLALSMSFAFGSQTSMMVMAAA